jgi:hypothetical protein
MTLIGIWHHPIDQGVWAIGDARVSVKGDTGYRTVTDSASKILPLSVVCVKLN